ncbi:MAG: AtpZ/AtpI family protein [Patescibacteria group bacterium]
MDFKKIIDARSIKTMAIATFYHTSGAILGPLLILGGLGYFLDRKFSSGPLYLIIGVFLAFVTTNILLFKKLGQINHLIATYKEKASESSDENVELLDSNNNQVTDSIKNSPVSGLAKNSPDNSPRD